MKKKTVIQTVNKLYAENRKNITKAGHDFSKMILQFVHVLNKTPAFSVVIGYCIHKFNRNLCNLVIILNLRCKEKMHKKKSDAMCNATINTFMFTFHFNCDKP